MTDKYIKSKEELEDCLRLEACVYVSDRNCSSRIVLRKIRDEVRCSYKDTHQSLIYARKTLSCT